MHLKIYIALSLNRKDKIMSINLKSKLGIFIKSMIIVFMLIAVGVMPTKLVSAKVIKNDKTGIPDKALYQAILFETEKIVIRR